MEKLKVSFVGFGWAAKNIWLPRMMAHNGYDLISAYDANSKAVSEVLADYPALQLAANLEQICSSKPDLVIITTPNITHLEVATFFLQRNISVFIEKPVCIGMEQYKVLEQVASTSRAKMLISQAAKLRGDVELVRKFIDDGCLGNIYAMELSWLRFGGIPNPGSWFTDVTLAGGGVGYDLGWHVLDVGMSYISYPDIDDACAMKFYNHNVACSVHQKTAWRRDEGLEVVSQVDVEDQMIGLLKTKNNVAIDFRVAWLANVASDKTTIIVHGDKASVHLTTTFGFSPNRVLQPCCTLCRPGDHQSIAYDVEPIGIEYDRQVALISELMNNQVHSNAAVLHEVYSVAVALDGLYASSSNDCVGR